MIFPTLLMDAETVAATVTAAAEAAAETAAASETATAAATSVVYKTAYTGTTIPVITIVMTVLCLVVVVGVAIAGFLYFREHLATWGNSLFTGIACCLGSYIISNAMYLAMANIPGFADYLQTNDTVYSIVYYLAMLIPECLASYLGVLYLKRQSAKGKPLDLGMIVIFGFSFFVMTALVNQRLSAYFEVALYAVAINSMGFDEFVSANVSDSMTLDQATQIALSVVEFNGWELFMDALNSVMKGGLQIIQAVALYGVMVKGVDKKWLGLFFGSLTGYYLMLMSTTFFGIPLWGAFVLVILLTAGSGYLCWKLIKENFAQELELFKYSKSHHSRVTREKKEKMPEIKMPD